MKRLSAMVLGCLLLIVAVVPSSAQDTSDVSGCTDFQVYWETLVGTVPDNPEGLDAFLAIVDAGPRTTLTEEQQVAAYQFLDQWATNVERVDSSLIPASATIYHNELVDDLELTSGILEYTDLADLSSTFSFWSVGIYVLLIEETATPTQCV